MNFYHQMSRHLVIYSADASNHRGWRAILGLWDSTLNDTTSVVRVI